MNRRRFPFLLASLLPGLLLLSAQAWCNDPEAPLSFCMFGPKVRVYSPSHPGNGCKGSAKIQAMVWECVAPEQVSDKVVSNRQKAVAQGKEECARHCRSFGAKCRSSFESPAHCGLETDLEEAIAAGRKLGCRKECSGNAFTYCSLYDAGYRMFNQEMIDRQAPNCRCFQAD